jgi:hypothetical protein
MGCVQWARQAHNVKIVANEYRVSAFKTIAGTCCDSGSSTSQRQGTERDKRRKIIVIKNCHTLERYHHTVRPSKGGLAHACDSSFEGDSHVKHLR